MRIIGIHGKARSGKDELCGILCETYGFERKAFADKVREFGAKYFELTELEMTDKKTKESRTIMQGIGHHVRCSITKVNGIYQHEAMPMGVSKLPVWVEEIAVEFFAVEPKDLKGKKKYVKKVLKGIFALWAENREEFAKVSNGVDQDIWVNYLIEQMVADKVYVITDIRHINEKDFVESSGGKVIKIHRIDKPEIEAGSKHPTETALDLITDWDYRVVNEHKVDWRERLVLGAANAVRKFESQNFFTSTDKDEFKIRI